MAIADLDGFYHRHDKDLAISDRALGSRASKLLQAIDRAIHEVVVYGDLQLDFSQQVGFVLCASVGLLLATLPGKSRSVADAHASNTDLLQRMLNRFKFRGLDCGKYQLHASAP